MRCRYRLPSAMVIIVVLGISSPGLAFDWGCFLQQRQAHREGLLAERPKMPMRDLEVQTRPVKDTVPLVHEYLTAEAAPKSVGLEKWYEQSVKLERDQVDPYFFKLAERLGGEVTFGGGSDLVEMTLGVPKLASPLETNIIMPRKALENPESLFQDMNDFSAPAWRGREAMEKVRATFNGESGADLARYVEAAAKGDYLVAEQPMIVVPLKHAAIVQIRNGEARMFFRTPTDLENYRARILTLPEQHKYSAEWLDKDVNRMFMPRNLEYSIFVYSRGITEGWTMHPTSVEIMRSWGKALTAKERESIVENVMNNAERQQIDVAIVKDVLTEINMPVPEPGAT